MTSTEPRFKLLVIGDGGCGKTCFVKRHISGEFQRKYVATLGVEVSELDFWTSEGKVSFSCWDTAGQERFGGLRDGYYILAEAAILMFDVTNRDSYKNVPNWYKDVRRVCGGIPMVLCGNKCDVKERSVLPKHITFHRKKNIQYYDISAKSNYNFEKPFVYLLRKLLNAQNLRLTEQICYPPISEYVISEEDRKRMEREIELAMKEPLPPDDEEDF
mmetsp:Transcript_3686/g.5596  ORF Transcript_3686/g.5596 Transcript_3686/m.5596 type:complete len:216 (-) Transcript_3686:35-682(-)|eukprot:CAMPEP_0201509324 /NCGR_PEP_ID=MMETSP0161_2-20130828/2418_1 /ASSEMBLY_ACC=CAM_ASM_000251 /TAXON_ID=180227 /ORGANISM="Neoparamoeba aestuarina, Strain SoJaBio B1-5/56/2" /LENGTH=215 /DNA_ID=CAMNT_0047904247 /DNA_START=191 /DNA_END=838 /DNA_ORIENTATION=-